MESITAKLSSSWKVRNKKSNHEYALKEMNLDAAIFDKRFLNHHGNVYVAFSQKTQKAKTKIN